MIDKLNLEVAEDYQRDIFAKINELVDAVNNERNQDEEVETKTNVDGAGHRCIAIPDSEECTLMRHHPGRRCSCNECLGTYGHHGLGCRCAVCKDYYSNERNQDVQKQDNLNACRSVCFDVNERTGKCNVCGKQCNLPE